MSIAIISDLHSNIEALDAVLEDITSRSIERIYCLGDLVGYGPNPIEVVDKAMEWDLVLIGNHDEAVLNFACGFNPIAKRAVEWTREQLKPGLFSGSRKKKRWQFLENLKRTFIEDRVFYVHASPRDHTMEYIFRDDTYDLTGEIPEKILDIFTKFEHLCIVGHTHEPGIITEESEFIVPEGDGYSYTFEEDQKYIINVGSVGQPRDRNPKSSYAILDGDMITFYRVEYNYKKTMEKILSNPSLDERSATRLEIGK